MPEFRVGNLIELRQALTRHIVCADGQMLAICIKCDSVNGISRRVAKLLEFQIAANRRIHRISCVCESGKVVVLTDTARRGHTARRIGRLENKDVHPCTCEIRRTNQAVMTCADDDCVCTISHR